MLETMKRSVFGGFLTGIVFLLIGASFSWGYFSTDATDKLLAIAANFPMYITSRLFELFDVPSPSNVVMAVVYIWHFLFWWVVYSAVKKSASFMKQKFISRRA